MLLVKLHVHCQMRTFSSSSEKVLRQCVKSLPLHRLLFSVITLLQDFKLKSLGINSLDLDEVMS